MMRIFFLKNSSEKCSASYVTKGKDFCPFISKSYAFPFMFQDLCRWLKARGNKMNLLIYMSQMTEKCVLQISEKSVYY